MLISTISYEPKENQSITKSPNATRMRSLKVNPVNKAIATADSQQTLGEGIKESAPPEIDQPASLSYIRRLQTEQSGGMSKVKLLKN